MPKNLKDILLPYPSFRQATELDNEGILEFFDTISMNATLLSLRYDRAPDYFAFIREQSFRVYTFLMETANKEIGGVASLALVEHQIAEEKVLCAYLGDLRIGPKLDARIRILWHRCYSDIIKNAKELEELKDVKIFYSAILEDNTVALTALTKRKSELHYHELIKYESINILGRTPFGIWPSKQTSYRIRNANAADTTGLRAFLSTANASNDIGYSDFEIERRFKNWKEFSISSFLVVENAEGKTLACCAPWSTKSRRLVIEKMALPYRIVGKLLRFLGRLPIEEGEEIKVLYLTHLEFAPELSRAECVSIMKVVLNYIYEKKMHKKHHMVSFITFPLGFLTAAVPRTKYLFQRIPGRIFQVIGEEDFNKQKFLKLDHEKINLEMAIL